MECRRLLVRIQSDAERFSLSNKCSINQQQESCSITYLYTIFILNLFILNILKIRIYNTIYVVLIHAPDP